MYQEVVLPGFAVPPHPCPGCGKDVRRGCSGLFVPHSVKERRAKNDAIQAVQPSERTKHLSRCPYQRLHPALLLACRSPDEVDALLAHLGINAADVGPNAPGS